MDEEERYLMRAIAHIHTDFPTKFGIPRQSGLVGALEGIVVFEPQFRSEGALRGLETYSHVWLLWVFSRALREGWSPTVRPPRLGGNKRMGVFATRSPFRPNAIGLSAVRLVGVEQTERFGAVLRVAGVDLMDNTPILDVKPYLPFADAVADASGGFSAGAQEGLLAVECPPQLLELVLRAWRSSSPWRTARRSFGGSRRRNVSLWNGAQTPEKLPGTLNRSAKTM